jgi:3-oxoacyl-[acyl-carrier-protein] synthase II
VDRLLAGESGIRPITAFSVEGRRSHTAALLRDFDPGRYYDPMKLRRVDEGGRLGLVSTRLAIDDAGLPTNTDEVGMVLGSATSGVHSTVQHLHKLATGGPTAVPAMGFANTIANAAASLCSIEFGLRGPNVTIGQKQASAIAAIAFAMAGLRQGRATAFVCGGIDDFEELLHRPRSDARAVARRRWRRSQSPVRPAPERVRARYRRAHDGARDPRACGPPRRETVR